MSEDQEANSDSETPAAGNSGGDEGGSSPGDWQAQLAERLAAQKARREAAQAAAASKAAAAEAAAADADAEDTEEETPAEEEEKAPPPKREEGPSEWERQLSTEIGATDELEIDTGPRSDLAGLASAQQTWAGAAGQARQTLTEAATWFGDSVASITSFLAPVPAMLLVFLNYKVPIPIPIPVMYKPETLKWSKKADWDNSSTGSSGSCSGKEKKTPFHNVPQATFRGGESEKLEFDLFFDTTDTQLDVRLLIKPIQALVYMVPLRNEPPLVMFSWGMILSKMSYIEDLDIDYTMFRADGTPLRAEVEIKLTEYDLGWLSAIPMNPTSYSEARKTWVVTEGQTLDWIAYQEYGNAMHWRHIAQVNNLSNPRDLRSGQILKLTPLP